MAIYVNNIKQTGGASYEIPKGGITGQVLAKRSNTDGDFEWKAVDVEPQTALETSITVDGVSATNVQDAVKEVHENAKEAYENSEHLTYRKLTLTQESKEYITRKDVYVDYSLPEIKQGASASNSCWVIPLTQGVEYTITRKSFTGSPLLLYGTTSEYYMPTESTTVTKTLGACIRYANLVVSGKSTFVAQENEKYLYIFGSSVSTNMIVDLEIVKSGITSSSIIYNGNDLVATTVSDAIEEVNDNIKNLINSKLSTLTQLSDEFITRKDVYVDSDTSQIKKWSYKNQVCWVVPLTQGNKYIITRKSSLSNLGVMKYGTTTEYYMSTDSSGSTLGTCVRAKDISYKGNDIFVPQENEKYLYISGDASDYEMVVEIEEVPNSIDSSAVAFNSVHLTSKNIKDAIEEVFRFANDTVNNMQKSYAQAIVGKGGEVIKTGEVYTQQEIVAGIEGIVGGNGSVATVKAIGISDYGAKWEVASSTTISIEAEKDDTIIIAFTTRSEATFGGEGYTLLFTNTITEREVTQTLYVYTKKALDKLSETIQISQNDSLRLSSWYGIIKNCQEVQLAKQELLTSDTDCNLTYNFIKDGNVILISDQIFYNSDSTIGKQTISIDIPHMRLHDEGVSVDYSPRLQSHYFPFVKNQQTTINITTESVNFNVLEVYLKPIIVS